jgi:hypothetical protein
MSRVTCMCSLMPACKIAVVFTVILFSANNLKNGNRWSVFFGFY